MESEFGRKCAKLDFRVMCHQMFFFFGSWCVNLFCLYLSLHTWLRPPTLTIRPERDFRRTSHPAVSLHRMAFAHVSFLECRARVSASREIRRWARDRCEQRRWADVGALQVSLSSVLSSTKLWLFPDSCYIRVTYNISKHTLLCFRNILFLSKNLHVCIFVVLKNVYMMLFLVTLTESWQQNNAINTSWKKNMLLMKLKIDKNFILLMYRKLCKIT